MRLSRAISTIRAAAVLAAIALVAPALSPAAAHRPDPGAAARAVGRYYASFGHEQPIAPAPDSGAAARAVGRYYASFGDEQPIPPPPSAAVAPVTTRARFDWTSAGAGAAAMLGFVLIAAAGSGLLRRARHSRRDDAEMPTGAVNA